MKFEALNPIGLKILTAAIICLLLTGLASAATGSEQASAKPLVGLWVAEQDFGPEIQGEITLTKTAAGMTVTAAGHTADVKEQGGEIRFEFPNSSDSFRGRFDDTTGQVRGHWIQATTAGLSYPHASPLFLSPIENEKGIHQKSTQYQGTIRPLEDRHHYYLTILEEPASEDSAAAFRAVMRNPERNMGMFLGLDTVTLNGGKVQFLDRDKNPSLRGSWKSGAQPEHDELQLELEEAGRAVSFKRFHNANAAHTVPTLSTVGYKYRAPRKLETFDPRDWDVASAKDVGLDPRALEELVTKIWSTPSTPSVYDPYIHAVLIARHGKLVLEEYFYGQQQNETHDTRSAGKSLASIMIGAAIDRSDTFDTKTRFVDVHGKDSPEPAKSRGPASFKERSKWRKQMTLEHLITMSSGLDCDDDDGDSPGNEGTMQDQTKQPDWVRYGLDLAMARVPGEKALYCSNSVNLAGATMARAVGVWLPDAFAEWIAAPLGIDRYFFNLSPVGDGYLGGGIRLTPRDQAKLGQTMLDGGVWKGKRVLSQDWVERSVAPHASIHEPGDYGYAWWRKEYELEGRKISAFYASGNGGQLVIALPELDMVVQFSAANYGNYGTWRHFRDDLVPDYILAAVEGQGAD